MTYLSHEATLRYYQDIMPTKTSKKPAKKTKPKAPRMASTHISESMYMSLNVPKIFDRECKLPIPSDCFRCSGCNLPTPREENPWVIAAPLIGLMAGVGCDVAVCRGCWMIGAANSGEGVVVHFEENLAEIKAKLDKERR